MVARRLTLGLVASIIGVGCVGDSSETGAPTSTTTPGAPDDALVPIAPVGTTSGTDPPTSTASPTTTSIAPRAFPEPDWPAVDLPTGPDLQPASLTLIIDPPIGKAYDIAPDGRHLALLEGSNRLCIVSTSDEADVTCADGVDPTLVVWSPDASRVLFTRSSFLDGTSGPLGTFSIEGVIDIVLETTDANNPHGGAVDAGFLDAGTVVYTRVISAESAYEVHTSAIDGSNHEIIGAFNLGGSVPAFLPDAVAFDGTSVYFRPLGLSMIPGIWRYEPTTNSVGLIKADDGPRLSDDDPTLSGASVPVAVRGGVLVSADAIRLHSYTSNQDEARFFDLTTVDGTATVPIDDLDDDYMIVSATLSPDGAHLAAYELYRGADSAVSETAAAGRVSLTSTASLFAGAPSWSTITDVGPGSPSRDLDRGFTTITWPTAERLYVELLDGVWAVDVTIA